VSTPAGNEEGVLRVLVLCDRWPVADAMGVRIASVLASRLDAVGVTLVAPGMSSEEADRIRAGGIDVESDGDRDWLASRPAFAAAVVFEGPGAVERFAAIAGDSQPQATVVYDMSAPGGDDHVADRRAEVAMLGSADVVLAPSQAHARFVGDLAPSAEVVVAAPGTPDLDRALAHALALTGIVVPDAALD
jgi:hypothetical protein